MGARWPRWRATTRTRSTRAVASQRRAHVLVSGQVQGVFFRDTTRRLATSRGVAGWVRNNPDGTVEAVFEGKAGAVEALVGFCREGPRGARVEDVRVSDEQVAGIAGFEVR